MADNYIKKINIGGTEYDISATSAGIADNATKLGGQSSSYYAKADDLTAATGDINTLKGYFTNGSAKSAEKATSATNAAKAADSDKLGGQSSSYYATSANLKTATDNISTLSGYFNNGSAKSAEKATSATVASKLANSRNIAASGDVTWSVSFDGSQAKTGAATINNIPSAVAWSAVSAEVNSKVSSVYHVGGTKTVAQINALGSTGITTGEVYNVSDDGTLTQGNVKVLAGDNVVWTGSAWDKLAATVDLSPYQTTAAMTAYYTKTSADSTFVAQNDSTYTNTTAYADNWKTNSGNYVTTARKVNGKALSADVTIGIGDISNLNTYTGYANDWDTNKASVSGSATSGAAASAYIKENESKWTNQNAYGSISVFTGANAASTTTASAAQDKFGFSAWGSNIKLTATSDANGHPIIGISAKNDNTKYSLSAGNGISANYAAAGGTTGLLVKGVDATSAAAGVTKASYVSENVAYIF